MVKVLIPTKPDDAHAVYVKLALEKKGHQAVLWYTPDFPTHQKHSFEVAQNNINWYASGIDFNINNDKFDVVWLRRPRKPVISKEIHVEDRKNAEFENEALFKTFWQVIAPNAFWVNPVNTSRSVNCKLHQLRVAAKVGLNIPETLISNDPAKIKNFIKKYNEDEVIYKTLVPLVWSDEKEMRLVYTKPIRIENLPSDSMLQNTPGIFQKRVKKAFELRVNYMGGCVVAAKLRSQEHPRGIMDWRFVPAHEMVIEEFEIPKEIDEKCKAFMKELGIVFGCFDFIVTPDNEYYFLEINEQGQFLWIEEVNPCIKMLDAFTEFLINHSNQFNWHPTESSISLRHFMNDVMALKVQAIANHTPTGTIY